MKKNQRLLKNDVAFKEHSATHQPTFTPDGPSEANDSNTKGPQDEVKDVDFEEADQKETLPGSLTIRVKDEDRKEGEKKFIHELAIVFNRVSIANVIIETFAKDPFEAKRNIDRRMNSMLSGELFGFNTEGETLIDVSTPEGKELLNTYLDKVRSEMTEERRKKSVEELRTLADKIESGEQDPVSLHDSPLGNIFQRIMQEGI